MPVPFSFPIPLTHSQDTAWPSGVPMFTQLATTGEQGREVVVQIDAYELHVDDANGTWTSRVMRDGRPTDAPWTREAERVMLDRIRALVGDMQALGDNTTAITDAAASAYGLGVGVGPVRDGAHARVQTSMPTLATVADWPATLPQPDAIRWDADRDAVVVEASYRTFLVQGEIITEKGHLLALDDAEREVVASWAKVFVEARGNVQTFLHLHTQALVQQWVNDWESCE